MNKSAMIASFFTVLFVLGIIAYRLLWAASSVASAAGLGGATETAKKLAQLASWRAQQLRQLIVSKA